MRGVGARRKERIKNQNDKRYIETQSRYELAIGKFLKMGRISRLNTPVVCNEAKTCNSTFYDHYTHMDEAVDLFFHKMEPRLKCLLKESYRLCCGEKDNRRDSRNGFAENGGANLEIIFFKILYFIYQNRDYYEIVISRGNSQALTKIAETFRPVIKRGWSNYGTEAEEKCFCLFSWELSGVLYYWGTFEKFDFGRITQHAKELSRLAQNATKRLAYG